MGTKEYVEITDDVGKFRDVKGRQKLRKILYGGSLLAVIVWGSAFLILAIARLKEAALSRSQVSETLISDKPDASFPHSVPYLRTFEVHDDNKLHFNFTSLREGDFRPNVKQVQWIRQASPEENDVGTYVLRESDEYERYVIKSIIDDSFEKTLLNDTLFIYGGKEYRVEQLIASPNLKKALLKTESTKNWRHSSFAVYWLFDIENHKFTPLYNSSSKVSIVSWSPNSEHILFVKDHNLYIRDSNYKKPNVVQVTYDGDENLFNGIPDWVYEEEVFETDIVSWWSPDSKKVAFLRMNDTLVPTMSIPYYSQNDSNEYPEYREIKYPKAGYSNPTVDLYIYDKTANSDQGQNVPVLMDFEGSVISEKIISLVFWVSETHLLVKITNRSGDRVEVFIIDSTINKSTLVRVYEDKNAWFEITRNAIYIPKNKSAGRSEDGYVDTVDVQGYAHLFYFSPPQNPKGIPLTHGEFDVVNGVMSFDDKNSLIYYISTQKSSIERHIYSVSLVDALTSNGYLIPIKNITDISEEGWYSGSFSYGSRYLLLNYDGPSVPYQALWDLEEMKKIKTIESNDHIAQNVDKYALPDIEYSTVSLGYDSTLDQEIKVNVVERKPPGFDPSKKYPVLFYVYGGPGSQLVTKRFDVSFSAVVASELNAIVVTVDGRGTGYKDPKQKFTVKNKLGYFEPSDQITAAKLWSKKQYVDENNIAIWGWSYGGFLTLKTLETDVDSRVFSYGAAVAPVTKWKYYDSIYTERYMGTPQENPEGYEIASIHNASCFESVKRFIIMHGSGDDNVHFQNSLKLLDDFNMHDIENFDFMVFPDSDHSISFHNANNIVYDRLLDWFKKAFSGRF